MTKMRDTALARVPLTAAPGKGAECDSKLVYNNGINAVMIIFKS